MDITKYSLTNFSIDPINMSYMTLSLADAGLI